NRSLQQSSGYQIQYSTSKSFKSYKTKTITSYKTSTTTLTGLKAKTTYYVRVRTYKTVGGTKIYSNWSSYKYKKTK
ncbi:MAG: fibronectin type III domain-containing protein, partial [Clostridia bacterium]|nr:fibronectin type III domain-containing protein [Clostridia bacterium]